MHTLYVGNVPYDTTEPELRTCFSAFGDVSRITMNKGYAHVAFSERSGAESALAGLHGFDFGGRVLRLNLVGTGAGDGPDGGSGGEIDTSGWSPS
eukprot:SAG25_NODE_143_length_14049_cov_6.050817_6_plen_95_part_00